MPELTEKEIKDIEELLAKIESGEIALEDLPYPDIENAAHKYHSEKMKRCLAHLEAKGAGPEKAHRICYAALGGKGANISSGKLKGKKGKKRTDAISDLWESIKSLFEPHLQEVAPDSVNQAQRTVKKNHPECPMDKPYALVDSDGKVLGCHASEADALKQEGAIYANKRMYLPTQARSFVITRQADGKARWLMIAASATINKANSIDSTMLFDNFIKHARDTNEYPVLDFLHHEDAIRFGVADWLARDGALYLASGTFDETELAQAAIAGLESQNDYWGASISYRITEPPMLLLSEGQIPVYTNGINRYISIVPKRMAANLFTAVSVTEEVMRMNKSDFDELVRLVGAVKAQEFAGTVDDSNRTITEVGLVTRADEPVTTIVPVEAVVQVPVIETAQVTETTPLPVIEERADEPWKKELSALAERLTKLEKMLEDGDKSKRATEERSVKELDEIKGNLAGVTVLAARWQQWLDDAPEHIKGEEHVIRARDTEPAAMTLAQIAEQNLSKMNRGPHTRRPQ